MAFSSHSTFLKADFLMSAVLCLLGFIILGSMASNSYLSLGDKKVCIILAKATVDGFHSSACVFTIISGLIIAGGGAGLFGMDYVTWKRSDNYKGKRASVAALLICPVLAFFSFSTAIVIGVGLKDFCKSFASNGGSQSCTDAFSQVGHLYTGVSCSTLAGFLFAFYGYSEYIQYRRRHINGDKW